MQLAVLHVQREAAHDVGLGDDHPLGARPLGMSRSAVIVNERL